MSSRLEQFVAKTRPATDGSGCILWTAYRMPNGYGRFGPGLAHRWIYAHVHGVSLGRWDFVLHSCDTPACVNLEHLRVGTAKDNSDDMAARNRRRAVGPKGERSSKAKLTADIVRAVRARYAAGGVSYRDLGEELGIDHGSVHKLVTRKSWAHVA